jgi:CRISPR/Cas system-associated exonuclease Cas4 (RecB family)
MFQGFVCAVTGENVAVRDCLACAQRGGREECEFPYPILKGIADHSGPRNLGADWDCPVVSVTELLGCPRQWRLRKEHEHYVKPSQAYWAFRGTIGHELLAGNAPLGAIVEKRFYQERGDYVVTGQPDLVTAQGVLVDYKTTKRLPRPLQTYHCLACGAELRRGQWKARANHTLTCPACQARYRGRDVEPVESPPEPYAHHVEQLNLYAWLLAQHDIEIIAAQVVYLDMAGVLRLQAPLHDLESVADLIDERLAAFARDERVKDGEDDPWNCRYCHVSGACTPEAVAEAPAETAEAHVRHVAVA